MKLVTLTIGAVVALVYVMGGSGRALALGKSISRAGIIYLSLAPAFDWIGIYMTSSDTPASILFPGLQPSVGQEIGGGTATLTMESMRQLLVGSNTAGDVVDKMIPPQSLTIASNAIGLMESESAALHRIIAWSSILLFLFCLLVGLTSTPVLSWLTSPILG